MLVRTARVLYHHPTTMADRRPAVMNAGSSDAGRAFAARNCVVLFTALIDHDRTRRAIAEIEARARGFGRSVEIHCSTHVVCRPTRREAEEFYHSYAVENADTDAVERLMELQGLYARSYPPELIKRLRTRFAGGHGSYPIVETPDEVAAEYAQIGELGVAGATMAAVDYIDAVTVFDDEILPRLERLGLRAGAGAE